MVAWSLGKECCLIFHTLDKIISFLIWPEIKNKLFFKFYSLSSTIEKNFTLEALVLLTKIESCYLESLVEKDDSRNLRVAEVDLHENSCLLTRKFQNLDTFLL